MLPDFVEDRAETTEGGLEADGVAALIDPTSKDFREAQADRKVVCVFISSLRLLAELVEVPPIDGPSYASLPTS